MGTLLPCGTQGYRRKKAYLLYICVYLHAVGRRNWQASRDEHGFNINICLTSVAKTETYLARFPWLPKPLRSTFCPDSTDCFGASHCVEVRRSNRAPRNDCTPGHAFTSEPLRRPSLRGRGTRTKQQRQTENCNRRRRRCEAKPKQPHPNLYILS